MIKAWFTEEEIPAVVSIGKNKEVTPARKVVFFHFSKPPLKGTVDFPTTFDGVATEEHKVQYPDAWAAFLKSKETVVAAPVEAPAEEAPKKSRRESEPTE